VLEKCIAGLVFYLVLTPIGLLLRLLKSIQANRITPSSDSSTYWITVTRSPASDSLKSQH
jgi:hypothetical protein